MNTRRMLTAAAFCLALDLVSARADLLLTPSFKNATESDWIIGGSATLTAATGVDTAGDGWLRLTPNSNNQAGYAIYNKPIASSQGIQVAFDYSIWGGGAHGADGLAVAIIDANHPPNTPGAYGGAIGYAQHGLQAGILGGMLGIALDEYGNFSTALEGRPGGTATLNPYTVSVRGPGNGTSSTYITAPSGTANFPNYNFLTKSATLSTSVLVPEPNTATRPTSAADLRHAVINFDMSDIANGHAYVGVTLSDGIGDTWNPIVNYDVGAALIGYYGVGNVPTEFEIALTAGTGGSRNTHELRNMEVSPSQLAGDFQDQPTSVPEPGLWQLFGIGSVGILFLRRRLNKTN